MGSRRSWIRIVRKINRENSGSFPVECDLRTAKVLLSCVETFLALIFATTYVERELLQKKLDAYRGL